MLNLTQDTTIGKKGDKIFVTNDSYQTWYIINDKEFNGKFISKINDLINKNKKYNFFDIGANTGLITRCLLNSLNNI